MAVVPFKTSTRRAPETDPIEPIKERLLEPIDLLDVEPEPDDPIVRHLIHKRGLTTLSGLAGSGKTYCMQMLMSAAAVGGRWFGEPVRQCRSLAILSEERSDKLQARQIRINRHYGIDWADIMGWWAIMPRNKLPNKNKIYSCYSRGREGTVNSFWKAIEMECVAGQYELLILDNTQNLYQGDFYNDTEVRSFLRWLDDRAMGLDIAIILLANPPKDRSSYYRGSVEWHNTPRYALSLNPRYEKKKERIKNEFILQVEKNSYLSDSHPFKDPGIALEWRGEALQIKEACAPRWNGYS